MNNNHYLWPLFTGDLISTKELLSRLWIERKICNTQAAHWALTLGENQLVSKIINNTTSNAEKKNIKDGISFRISRKSGQANPYQQIMRFEDSKCDKIQKLCLTNGFKLDGGIGDYIEDLAVLLPWYKEKGKQATIYCSKVRAVQFRRILTDHCWKSDASEANNIYTSKILMAALGDKLPKAQAILKTDFPKTKIRNNLLCCWKASGEADLFSSWTRSIVFKDILDLYKRILKEGRGEIKIVDCTKWQRWQQDILKRINIKIYRPEEGDILDLIEVAQGSKEIITIDTALAHLGTALGAKVNIAMPQLADERWVQLLQKGNSYERYCKINRQTEYNNWCEVLNNIEKSVSTFRP